MDRRLLAWPHWPFLLLWTALAYTVWVYAAEVQLGGEPWKTGDWLINEQGGWVRRGWPGELLWQLSRHGMPLLWLSFGLQVLLSVGVLALVQALYLSSERDASCWVLLLSPAFMLFAFYDVQAGFRKETLFFLSLAWLGWQHARHRMDNTALWVAGLAYGVGVFGHEMGVFLLPFYVRLMWLSRCDGQLSARQWRVAVSGFVGVAVLGLVWALRFPGDAVVADRVCRSLAGQGLAPDFCEGAIASLSWGPAQGWHLVRIRWLRYLFTYPVLAALAVLPVLDTVWWRSQWRFWLLSACALLPLLALAIDWGRWLHVWTFGVLTLFLADVRNTRLPLRFIPLWSLVPYLLLWSIPHCCASGPYWGWLSRLWPA